MLLLLLEIYFKKNLLCIVCYEFGRGSQSNFFFLSLGIFVFKINFPIKGNNQRKAAISFFLCQFYQILTHIFISFRIFFFFFFAPRNFMTDLSMLSCTGGSESCTSFKIQLPKRYNKIKTINNTT